MSSANFNASNIREGLQRLAAVIKHLFQPGATEGRRKVFFIISVVLCVAFFIPIYFVDFHMHSDFVRFDMSDTFSLFQLMTDPGEYMVDDEGAWAYIIYLLAPALMAFLAYRREGKDLFRLAAIPSALYLLLFFASQHVAADPHDAKYFGLTLVGIVYLVALAFAAALSVYEFVSTRKARPVASNAGIPAAQPVQETLRPHFCPTCGAPLDPRDRFCVKCGTKIPDARNL